MNWWVTDVLANLGVPALVAWVFWVVASICLHELGHGVVAIWRGDRTPIETGHMTLNPMVHMGPASLLVFAVAGFAWGMMPVNPSRFRGRYDDALVAAAGPAVNLVLAVVCTVAGALWIAAGGDWGLIQPNPTLFANMQMFFLLGAMLNTALMLFNLLPVPPLDGSRIVATFVPAYRRAMESPAFQQAAIIGFLVLFFVAGGVFFDLGFEAAIEARARLLAVLLPGRG